MLIEVGRLVAGSRQPGLRVNSSPSFNAIRHTSANSPYSSRYQYSTQVNGTESSLESNLMRGGVGGGCRVWKKLEIEE